MYLVSPTNNMNQAPSSILATTCLFLALFAPKFAQAEATTAPQEPAQKSTLTKFDLDFPGGTPQELASAIQKSMGRPLNVIVPTSFAELRIPPLMMKHVDVAQLFKALASASPTNITPPYANSPGEFFRTGYAFRTDGNPSDDSIWYFTAEIPPRTDEAQRAAYFFNLTPYLDQGLTVDDITTAIHTGWKMAGNSTGSELSYHKETKLLIVVGNRLQIETVNSALAALMQQVNATLSAFMEEKKANAAAATSSQGANNGTETKKPEK